MIILHKQLELDSLNLFLSFNMYLSYENIEQYNIAFPSPRCAFAQSVYVGRSNI